VFAHSAGLVRTRPTPDTWCPVEYAQHTAFAIGSIEWAARQFVDGRSPDWTQEPPGLAGVFDHETHDCDRFELASTLGILDAAAKSLAAFALSLRPDEQHRKADYGRGLVISTATVVRHAVHDAEHHLLDIRRGIARLRLTSAVQNEQTASNAR
jgi:hypothetical protein